MGKKWWSGTYRSVFLVFAQLIQICSFVKSWYVDQKTHLCSVMGFFLDMFKGERDGDLTYLLKILLIQALCKFFP